jgi:hypothetical protein
MSTALPTKLVLLAQFTLPVSQPVQLLHYITDALDQLIAPTSSIFLGNAIPLLNKLGLLALVLGALTWTYDYLTGNHIFSGEHFWRVLIRYLIAYNLLRYYNAPLPLVGYSFHQIFTVEGGYLASQIDSTTLNTFLSALGNIWGNLEKPSVFNYPAAIVYFWTAVAIVVMEGALFIITAFSFVAIGVGLILGPFFIVSYLFRGTAHFFWAWVNFMVKYSLYKVVAAALVFIFSSAIVNFLNGAIHGDYSIGHFWALLIPLTILSAVALFSCLKVGSLVNDLTTGGAYAGTGSPIPVPVISRFF